MRFVDDDNSSPLSCEDLYSDMKSWIAIFIENKQDHGLAEKSLKSYEDALLSFLNFVKKHSSNNKMENIGAKFVNRYLIEYQSILAEKKFNNAANSVEKLDCYNRVIKQVNKNNFGRNDVNFEVLPEFSNTLLHRTSIIKMLLIYISENNDSDFDYRGCFSDIKTISIKEKDSDFITVDEMDKVIDLMRIWITVYKAKGNKPRQSLQYAYRNSLMILIYALTGARSEEVVMIKLKDISLFRYYGKDYYKIYIANGKGGKQREVAVEEDFIKYHINYLKQNLPSDDYYLSSRYSKNRYLKEHMNPDLIRKFGNDILKILGIEKSGLHSFRRGYAIRRVFDNKKPLAIVAKELGHSVTTLEKHYLIYKSFMGLQQEQVLH